MHTVFFILISGVLSLRCNADNAAHSTVEMKEEDTLRTAFPDRPLAELLDELSPEGGIISLHIDKSDRKLQVLSDSVVIKIYPVVLGGNPVGDKRMEGDQKTPEGRFQIRSLYPHARWSKFLWIDYPTAESEQKFEQAKASGEIPSDATIGGEIGIHGVPEGMDHWIDAGENWTLGCISLKNVHIDEIYDEVRKGTVVIIVP